MPKTPIDKHSNLLAGKNNIWFASNGFGFFLPSIQSHSCKHGPQALFKPCAFAFDGLHGFSSVFRT